MTPRVHPQVTYILVAQHPPNFASTKLLDIVTISTYCDFVLMPLSYIVDSSYIETKSKHNFVLKNVHEHVQARNLYLVFQYNWNEYNAHFF